MNIVTVHEEECFMSVSAPEYEREGQPSADLEPELHEGDGLPSAWLWVVVGAVILFAAALAPFQLAWPL